MKFTLKKPCRSCPFRRSCLPGWLGATAVRIALTLDSGFLCHQTYTHDESGKAITTPESKACAGALIMQAKQGYFYLLNRLAIAAGLFDPASLEMGESSFDVFDSPREFVAHHQRPPKKKQRRTPKRLR